MAIAQLTHHLDRWQVYARCGISAIIAALLPIVLWYTDSNWLRFSYTRYNALFEYFGFSASAVLIANLIVEVKSAQRSFKDRLVPILLFSLTAFAFLVWFSEYSVISYDFSAYQNSANALLGGRSPYGNEPAYIYPPLLVYLITFLYKTVQWISVNVFLTQMSTNEYFYLVFYLYQVSQYCLTLISFGLVYLFARSLNHTRYSAALLVTLLFLANLPLLRNFRLNQVNLWVLIVLLLAILLVDRYPVLAGAFVALGGHIKVYPLVALIPWLISRKWLAAASAVISGLLIFLAQLLLVHGWRHWVDFFSYLQNVERGVALRNNSLHSLAWNLAHLLLPGGGDQIKTTTTTLLTIGLTALAVAWITRRYWQRMKAPGLTDQDRFLGNFMDTIVLMFFISPSVWDHHLVAAIPLAVWAATVGIDQLFGRVGLGLVLIFWVPTFDVFFFSYVHLAGIILLLIALPPGKSSIPAIPIGQPLQINT
jgi:hypothetical protein